MSVKVFGPIFSYSLIVKFQVVLYILDNSHSSVVSFASIISQSVVCLLIFLINALLKLCTVPFTSLTYTFDTILYQFRVYSPVIRHLYNLGSDHPDKSSAHLAPHIVYRIIDCIPCAVLYIPVTIL